LTLIRPWREVSTADKKCSLADCYPYAPLLGATADR